MACRLPVPRSSDPDALWCSPTWNADGMGAEGGTWGSRCPYIELTAAADGLTIVTGDQTQVTHYWYDKVPCGSLRQFFRCPSCERVCKRLYFDKHWGCRVCLGLRYPIRSTPADRTLVARQIDDMRRRLIETRPGSPQWRDLLARIAAHYALLTLDVARVRRDLRRRLKNDYRR